jgi:hypothetical protein
LTAFDVIDPPKPKVQEPVKKVIKCEPVSCSSKTADLLDSLTLQDETVLTPTLEDDARIAELLQAEFDLEYDEEIKRLEASRNKSKEQTLNFIILCQLILFQLWNLSV